MKFNSIEQSPWETNSRTAGEDASSLLRNSKAQYSVCKNLSLFPVQIQKNVIYFVILKFLCQF
jgi:hypothetical protein